jgi:hypothetical protein
VGRFLEKIVCGILNAFPAPRKSAVLLLPE